MKLWTLPADMAGAFVKHMTGARTVGFLPGEVLFARLPPASLLARALVRSGKYAITIGRFVLTVAVLNDEQVKHEREHVRQWNTWGVFFPLAYLVASLWAAVQGDAYWDNYFERQARGE